MKDTFLSLRLTEPVIFLRGGTDYSTSHRPRRRRHGENEYEMHESRAQSPPVFPPSMGPAMHGSGPSSQVATPTPGSPQLVPQQHNEEREEEEGPPALLRGLLTLTLAKPTRIRKIDARLKGYTRTEWPEGIGPRRLEVSDETILIEETFTFFNAAEKQNSRDRRAASVGHSDRPSRFERKPSSGETPRASSVMPTRDTSIGPAFHGTQLQNPTLSRMQSRQSMDSESGFSSPFLLSPSQSASPSRAVSRQNSRSTPLNLEYGLLQGNALPRLDPDTPTGYNSAPAPSSVRSSIEHLPLEPTESIPTVKRERSSSRTSRPSFSLPAVDRNRERSHTPRGASKTRKNESSPHARFSLAGIGDALRSKSKAREPAKKVSENESIASVGERSRSRGRAKGLKALREALVAGMTEHGIEDPLDSDEESHHDQKDNSQQKAVGWREFKPGTYTWALLVPLSVRLPPSLECGFGTNLYKFKATVRRAGALTSNITADTELDLVAAPGDDDVEESESIVVDRMWETQLSYMIALNHKSFPIGGHLPISIRLRPLGKVKVYRISVVLEEKITYYASDRHIQRSEAIRKFPLLKITHADESLPLLPILSDSPDAISMSPLAHWMINPTSSDDTTPSCLDPLGPWELEGLVDVPKPDSGIKFTTTNPKSNISVTHVVKVIIRVDRGDDEFLDAKGKRKKWDIIVEANVHVLSHRCAQNLLPPYSTTSPMVTLPRASRAGHGPFLGRPQHRSDERSGYDPETALAMAEEADRPLGSLLNISGAVTTENGLSNIEPESAPPPAYVSEEDRGRSQTRRAIE